MERAALHRELDEAQVTFHRLVSGANDADLRRPSAGTGGQALGVKRQHHLIDTDQSALPLAHDLRLEAARPIARHVDLDRAAAFGEHGFRQALLLR